VLGVLCGVLVCSTGNPRPRLAFFHFRHQRKGGIPAGRKSQRGSASAAVDFAVAIFEKLVDESPAADPFIRADLGLALWDQTRGYTGAQALAISQHGVDVRRELVREYPRSAEFRRDLSVSLHWHADATSELEPEKGLTLFREAIALRYSVWHDLDHPSPEIYAPIRPPDRPGFFKRVTKIWIQRDTALSCLYAAQLCLRMGRFVESKDYADEAASILKPLVTENSAQSFFIRDLGQSFVCGAEAARRGGDEKDCAARRQAALAFWTPLSKEHPENPGIALMLTQANAATTAPTSP